MVFETAELDAGHVVSVTMMVANIGIVRVVISQDLLVFARRVVLNSVVVPARVRGVLDCEQLDARVFLGIDLDVPGEYNVAISQIASRISFIT